MQTVIETPGFIKDAARAGMSHEEVLVIVNALSAAPRSGDLMPGSGGARKVRFPAPGQGKRGGYRTVHYYAGDDVPIFLLAVIKKGERSDLSQAEKNELRKELAGIVHDYREAVVAKARKLRIKK
jgi:hypothetical protein